MKNKKVSKKLINLKVLRDDTYIQGNIFNGNKIYVSIHGDNCSIDNCSFKGNNVEIFIDPKNKKSIMKSCNIYNSQIKHQPCAICGSNNEDATLFLSGDQYNFCTDCLIKYIGNLICALKL